MPNPAALPKAMLIDMDDTILTLTHTASQCWLDLVEGYAPRVNGGDCDALQAALLAARGDYWRDAAQHRAGRLDLQGSRRAIIAQALIALGLPDAAATQELAAQMAHTLTESILGGIVPFPGAVETVVALRERGVRLALITNGEAREQRRKITQHNLAPLFDCVVVEGEFGVGKPDPAVYHHALAQLDVTPADAWMIGDNLEWEVRVPQTLGLYTVWVDFAAQGLPADSPARPDRIIHTLAELLPPA